MNIPLPNFKEMDEATFIRWVCAIVLGYILLINPSSLSSKIDSMATLQAQMVVEHSDLLKIAQVMCINHADNVEDKEKRAKHQLRCLTLQVNEIPKSRDSQETGR